jgi:beta-mannosidase
MRIRNHPSIALWNGNNEVWIGWQEWGWKNGLDTMSIYKLESMYTKIFKELIPSVINKYTPEIPYW